MNKYEKIAKRISEEIASGKILVGQKLPSVVQISKEFSVSSVTAHRAVKELENMGLVKCRSGVAGTLVVSDAIDKKKTKLECVACLLRPFTPDYERFGQDYIGPSLLIASIQKSISAAGGSFIHHTLSEPNCEAKMLELCRKPWVDGIILDGHASPDLVSQITDSGKPTVLFGRRQVENMLSVIMPDIESMCRETVEFLVSHQYKTLFFFAKSDSMSWISEGVRLSIEYLEANMAEAAETAGLEFIGLEFESDRKACEKLLTKHSAIFFTSQGHVQTLLKTLDMSIESLNAKTGLIYCFPPCVDSQLSHWRYRDTAAFGNTIVRELLARIKTPDSPPVITKVPLDFIDNASA